MKFSLASHSIFVALSGSRAHGTANADSDVDLRGVCVAPGAIRWSLFESFQQYEGPVEGELEALLREPLAASLAATESPGDAESRMECVIQEVAKFLKLCGRANPSALEALFTDDRDVLFRTAAWDVIADAREEFLDRRVEHTFTGYALSQLKRIKTHRGWLLSPVRTKPERSDFGLPDGPTLSPRDRDRIEKNLAEARRALNVDDIEMPNDVRQAVNDRLDSIWNSIVTTSADDPEREPRRIAAEMIGIPPDILAALEAERRYRAAHREWQSYETWRRTRNPARAALEAAHGYDTKHAAHLVRLMRMGIEALEEGTLHIRRPDADELRSIRVGALDYDGLMSEIDRLQDRICVAAEKTRLPAKADSARIDQIYREVLRVFGD